MIEASSHACPEHLADDLRFLQGGGRASALILARDWSEHPLGHPRGWPDTLKVALSLVLNSPESMLLAWGREALTFFFNDSYMPLLGPRVSWAMGSPFQEVWADAWAQAKPIVDAAFAGRRQRYTDLPWKLATDRGPADTWFTFSYSRVLEPGGEVAGLFVLTNETTDRVLADAAAQESAARLRLETERQRLSLQQMPGFAALLAGPDHVYEYVNDAYVTIAGARRIIGRGVREVFPELASQGFFELLEDVYRTGTPFNGRAVPLQLQGEAGPRYIDVLLQPIRDDLGAVSGIFVGGYDVTDQIRAQLHREALLTLDDRLRDVADPAESAFVAGALLGETLGAVRAGYGVIDFDTKTITVERAWSKPGYADMAGVHRFSAYGVYGEELGRGQAVAVTDVTGDPRTAAHAASFQVFGTRAFLDVPVQEAGRVVGQLFVHANEPRTWTNDEIDFVREFAERTRTAIARRRAETELRAYNDRLEARVAQRTAELETAHEALRQAQKMEAVGQLTGGIAHDFNNLLMGINGSLELLERGLTRRGVQGLERYLQGAQASARRAASLTQRLLAFSRRQTLDPKPTDVNRLIYGMEDIIRRTVGPAIEVEVVGQAGLWSTRIDAAQLESALLNLAINARDAMPDGGRITIESANKWLDDRGAAERDLTPGQYLSICVSDTGSGIPKEVVGRIFDPFFTTKPIGEGTGLGLSMVHGFVRQSGGQVRVYSEVGKGTTMCLYLPRHLGELPPDDVLAPKLARTGQGETVLLVDDEPTVRMLMSDVLSEAGYGILEAHDGAAALRALESDARIDLLVTDVGLPGGMNGRQVADAARGNRPELKVLFVTGFAENAAVGNGHLPVGMQVITKPFLIAEFAQKVRDIIDGVV